VAYDLEGERTILGETNATVDNRRWRRWYLPLRATVYQETKVDVQRHFLNLLGEDHELYMIDPTLTIFTNVFTNFLIGRVEGPGYKTINQHSAFDGTNLIIGGWSKTSIYNLVDKEFAQVQELADGTRLMVGGWTGTSETLRTYTPVIKAFALVREYDDMHIVAASFPWFICHDGRDVILSRFENNNLVKYHQLDGHTFFYRQDAFESDIKNILMAGNPFGGTTLNVMCVTKEERDVLASRVREEGLKELEEEEETSYAAFRRL